ncbi:MAG: FAD-dependent oxidoreductase [Flavobacteriales bacterium]|nr:FAD-dependent oxidoreductase [Flavobacteriales bacterium]MDP4717043.1 FAD-dependent oxidoreductase [Flavobacteriales bacterium]MDP4730681.1 FAD-dependent oxidoreductase [Flavobacteriales bacterium]MDP4819203.1 FAD-dependent oxidoreductase [Flavobacteriales bacterium]MDP4950464.1 FAD-dependent oxidoreductase [Flavobacteriales bacterium]
MSKYLIVGQGLAGTLLAFSLLEKGEEVLIADDYKHASASQVAAGMWNPVTFKRLAASWLAKEMLEEMNLTFRKLEDQLQTKFFHVLPVARIFNSIQDANFWDEKSDHPEVGRYLSARSNKSVQENFNSPFGNSEVNECGWLNVPLFREAARNYFIQHGNFIEDTVNEKEVEFIESSVVWKASTFDKLILCNGIGVNQWKGLEHLDLIPNHGQVLDLKIENLELDAIVNFGQFLLPYGNNKFRLGATYNWNEVPDEPTDEAKEFLLAELKQRIDKYIVVESQKTGFRPTTRDRRPIIGFAKENEMLAVFGGLGSKGVLLAPYFSKLFATGLTEGTSIPKEVSAARF